MKVTKQLIDAYLEVFRQNLFVDDNDEATLIETDCEYAIVIKSNYIELSGDMLDAFKHMCMNASDMKFEKDSEDIVRITARFLK